MNFKNDKAEIIEFINSSINGNALLLDCCVERFTEKTEDIFLNERAAFIENELSVDDELRVVFCALANICNETVKKCDDCPVRKYCNHYINQLRKSLPQEAPKIVDLFCGAGGLSLGFTQEGFVTSLANDITECCVDTYAHNHPETPRKNIVLGDIKDVVPQLDELLGNTIVDVVIGGPPCQGFSMANRQRLIDDPRNHLYKSFVEVVGHLKPKFFIMENVKGMLPVATQVKEDFERIGYQVEYQVLNAKDFGVPQNRERLIYIGNNIDICNKEVFAVITNSSKYYPDVTLGDALYGLRELKASRTKNNTEQGSFESGYKIEHNNLSLRNDYIDLINQNKKIDFVLNHKARYNNDRDIEIFSRLNQGDKSDDPKIADIMPYARRNGIFKDKYYKLASDKISKTITAHMKFDCNMYIHPTQARGLTPREAARIQSYPDDYFFRGAYTKTYMQIGNSVPPLLGRVIAKVIKKYLMGSEADDK